MERYHRLIIILLAVIITIPVILKCRLSPEKPAPAAFSVVSSTHGHVQIHGDVRHPGIYSVTVKAMTYDVIKMAIPAQPISTLEPPDAGTVPVVTGEALELHIRSNGTATLNRGIISTSQRLVLGVPLDINVMSESDLDKVPGIGPALAKRIVLYRQNNGGRMFVKDLLMVEGIGDKKFNALRKFF